MAPWSVVICVINSRQTPEVGAAAETLYRALQARGIEVLLDDRGLRPGAMFADVELIGIPHRIVVSERGVAAGTLEYRARDAEISQTLSEEQLFALLG